jgi:hypothetical protein
MIFTEIFKSSLKYWPIEIDISDGIDVDSDSGNFRILSNYWDKAEKDSETESEDIQLMIWAIFCGLHKLARIRFLDNEMRIKIDDIDLKYVSERFEESLFDNENNRFVDYRKGYINDL